jgi:hypothetical protein
MYSIITMPKNYINIFSLPEKPDTIFRFSHFLLFLNIGGFLCLMGFSKRNYHTGKSFGSSSSGY